jgi:hypothetical protein
MKPSVPALLLCLACPFSAGAQANQVEFRYAVPANAGVGLPFTIQVCATNGAAIDAAYATPIALSDNGSTAAYTFLPASPQAPSAGCVVYTITPASTGSIDLEFGNADFPLIQTGPIPVAVYQIPAVAYSAEIFETDPAPQANADTLNNAWETLQGDSCVTALGLYETVYGTLSYDVAAHEGAIGGLTVLTPGSAGVPHPGTVTYRLVNMNGPLKGTHFTTNDGTLSANPTQMQAGSPKPAAISGDLHYTENTGSLVARNAIRFIFSTPAEVFGLWLGDLETNPFGTNAEALLFNGDALLAQVPILTSSTLAEQQNLSGTGCGSAATYPGCGNRSTRWLEFSGAPVTDLIIVVGDDDVAGQGLTEHISFGGCTMGGTCNPALLAAAGLALEGEALPGGVQLRWGGSPSAGTLTLERRAGTGAFAPVAQFAGPDLRQEYLDTRPAPGLNAYRLHAVSAAGHQMYSPAVQVFVEQAPAVWTVAPQPAQDRVRFGAAAPAAAGGRLEIRDLAGRIWHQAPVEAGAAGMAAEVAGWPAGVYVWSIQTADGQISGSVP